MYIITQKIKKYHKNPKKWREFLKNNAIMLMASSDLVGGNPKGEAIAGLHYCEKYENIGFLRYFNWFFGYH